MALETTTGRFLAFTLQPNPAMWIRSPQTLLATLSALLWVSAQGCFKNECLVEGESWCEGDSLHLCVRSDSEAPGPELDDIDMYDCRPGMCASWRGSQNQRGAGCLLTKDPCPPGVDTICVLDQVAWCTPDRQAVETSPDGYGGYCQVSPVDGNAYLAYDKGTCAPEGSQGECSARTCHSRSPDSTFPLICGGGESHTCEKGLWLKSESGCVSDCHPFGDNFTCATAASLVCSTAMKPFCFFGMVWSCRQSATGWEYESTDCMAAQQSCRSGDGGAYCQKPDAGAVDSSTPDAGWLPRPVQKLIAEAHAASR